MELIQADGTCTQIVTDIERLAKAEFTRASLKRAESQLVDGVLPATLGTRAFIALSRAAELRAALKELQRIIDPADPQLVVVNSILAILK